MAAPELITACRHSSPPARHRHLVSPESLLWGTVNRSCEKLGCNELAEVAFGIDRAACVVWLEIYDADEPRHLNRLCGDHSARLTLPRGWTFDDRREKSPRLFVAPRPSVAKAPSATKTKPTAKVGGVASSPASAKRPARSGRTSSGNTTNIPRRTSRDSSAPVKRFDGPGLFDPTLPIGSPLLVNMAEPVNDAERSADPTDSADAQYTPKFDRTSDVGGALKATGRLLSRAFSSQTKPIERPTGIEATTDVDTTTSRRRTSDTDSLPQGDHIDDFHQGDHVE